jgi:hypothetical protein
MIMDRLISFERKIQKLSYSGINRFAANNSIPNNK